MTSRRGHEHGVEVVTNEPKLSRIHMLIPVQFSSSKNDASIWHLKDPCRGLCHEICCWWA